MPSADEYYLQDEISSELSDGDEHVFAPFNPTARDDESDYSIVSANRKRQRKLLNDVKSMDKAYHLLKRKVNNKKENVEVYSTNTTPGSMIRDAVTGLRYPEYRVGSISENLFFKIVIATGEIDQNGSTLFFDSPEQYERHFKCGNVVSQSDKERWTNKCVETRILFSK
jgi:hypothetical protein